MRMKRKGLAEAKRPFRHTAPKSRQRAHLAGAPARLKRAVNVSVDAELLKVAKEMKINLSQALERALEELTADERANRFYQENKASIDAHNALVKKCGTLSQAYAREFGDGD
jgi:antitoxin CcdA